MFYVRYEKENRDGIAIAGAYYREVTEDDITEEMVVAALKKIKHLDWFIDSNKDDMRKALMAAFQEAQ